MRDAETHVAKRPLSGGNLALVLLIVALWGGNTVAVRYSVDTLPPVAVAAVRFVMAAVVLAAWCRLRGVALTPSPRELRVASIAGCLLFAQIATFNVAVLWTNATHGAMLINTFPFFVAGIEHVTGADRFGARRILGLVVAALGVAWVMADPQTLNAENWRAFWWGDLLLLASSVLLALRVIYVGRHVAVIPPERLMLWHDVVAVVLFVGWSFATESWVAAELTWPALLGLLYQGVVISGFCFLAHATLLRTHRAAEVSVFSFATPIFGVAFSIGLRDEPLTFAVVAGAVCVALGIWAVNRRVSVSKNKGPRS